MALDTNRRGFLAGAAAIFATGGTWAKGVEAASPVSAGAAESYKRAIVIDALGSIGGFDPASKPDILLPRFLDEIRNSGVTAVHMTVGPVGNGPDRFRSAVEGIAEAERALTDHPDLFMKIRRGADLREAKASGKVGLIYGFQDTVMLEGDLERLGLFHDLGIRIVQPTYNRRNMMGDGALEPANGGLSLSGHELVTALNQRRMLVDLSHAGSRVQAEGIALSTRPCAITHSGCRALSDNPRNTHDAEIRALAEKGGVLGIYFMPFLNAKSKQHREDVIRHIEHAVQVAGEDHVGLGTDGGIPAILHEREYRAMMAESHKERSAMGVAAPGESADAILYVPEYNSPRRFEWLADDLMKRGHGAARVEKILGGNFARLFEEVWG